MTTDDHDGERAEATDRAIESIFELGRIWAGHGLEVGRLALETSARTLRITADALGKLRDDVAEHRTEA